MEKREEKKGSSPNKADTSIEKSVAAGLQANRPFGMEETAEEISLGEGNIEDANYDIAKKEFKQNFHNG